MQRREKGKVLLADRKSPSLPRVVKALEAEGLKVSLAHECEAARKALRDVRPDVLICSQTLPHGGGYGLCTYLRKEVDPTAASIVLLSGNGHEPRELARKCGADHYLVRPASPKEIASAARAMLVVRGLRNSPPAESAFPSDAFNDGAVIDPQTGFYRFDRFKEVLFVEVKRSKRYGFPISLLLARYGSQPKASGSRVIAQLGGGLALAVRRSIRDTDIPVSYGRNHIMILMPQTDTRGANLVARRILFRVARGTLRSGSSPIQPTISIGVAGSNHFTTQFSDLVKEANLSLEEAIRRGGSCVVPSAA
jgi:diguanylate cyclase (GGDEF)-like protein